MDIVGKDPNHESFGLEETIVSILNKHHNFFIPSNGWQKIEQIKSIIVKFQLIIMISTYHVFTLLFFHLNN